MKALQLQSDVWIQMYEIRCMNVIVQTEVPQGSREEMVSR